MANQGLHMHILCLGEREPNDPSTNPSLECAEMVEPSTVDSVEKCSEKSRGSGCVRGNGEHGFRKEERVYPSFE